MVKVDCAVFFLLFFALFCLVLLSFALFLFCFILCCFTLSVGKLTQRLVGEFSLCPSKGLPASMAAVATVLLLCHTVMFFLLA